MDAAIQCLIEDGYADTTIRRVAERADVTPGALQHHFASKVDLLAATARHITAKMAEAMLAQGLPSTASLRRRHELLLDRMWALYRGPLFQAAVELLIAARTDELLRHHQVGNEDEIARWMEIGAPILYPEFADSPDLVPLIVTGQATMRGLLLMAMAGQIELDAVWPTARDHLLAMSSHVLNEPELSP
jgi:AcrR family transcriptional regulator